MFVPPTTRPGPDPPRARAKGDQMLHLAATAAIVILAITILATFVWVATDAPMTDADGIGA